MEVLNLPKTDLKLQRKGNRLMVFDIIRKKMITLTPEEWVRQHFIHFLINQKGYNASCIANEVALNLNNTQKRCDTVVYDSHALPIMIVEYKASHIPIDQKVFNQISRYNIKMHVRWLVVSNGMQHYCCRINYEDGTYEFMPDIPSWQDLRP
ncbi:MAG: type I restriction enzyme HsdR N-terminal domain-containing protein [Bacteroidaceae bacterium]|nr:type I restriction enzyme HsdR N-terminal domain-containing protein [Bacteroidaceae bacterium]MBR1902149.1 type I restriction enzyme HsdR N-terminal domain-containing protein [Bacteroidaceae bacterium]